MKYLTKGELLLTLGDSANNFTAFMMSPTKFGLVEPMLTQISVAKQKLDWADSINLDRPEVISMIQLLVNYGVITQASGNLVLATPDRSDADVYMITVRAQDDITLQNAYGATWNGDTWNVVIEYNNRTKGTVTSEENCFGEVSTSEQIQAIVTNRIIELKRIY